MCNCHQLAENSSTSRPCEPFRHRNAPSGGSCCRPHTSVIILQIRPACQSRSPNRQPFSSTFAKIVSLDGSETKTHHVCPLSRRFSSRARNLAKPGPEGTEGLHFPLQRSSQIPVVTIPCAGCTFPCWVRLASLREGPVCPPALLCYTTPPTRTGARPKGYLLAYIDRSRHYLICPAPPGRCLRA
jgi:hypothetical protein